MFGDVQFHAIDISSLPTPLSLCTLAVRVFAGDLPLAPYVSHEGYKHTTNLCSKQERSYGVSLTALRCRREGFLRDGEEGAAAAAHHLAAAAAATAMLDHTYSLSLSPSSIHTHAYTHVSTQGRRR